jgi:hypothetical protein
MVAEAVLSGAAASVGNPTQPTDQCFDFERCCGDDENAQSYFLEEVFGLRMFTPPWLRNGRGVIISIISLCVGAP